MKGRQLAGIVVAAVLVLGGVATCVYVSGLQQANILLDTSLNQMNLRIAALEKEDRISTLIALNAENLTLKDQVHLLQQQLARLTKPRELTPQAVVPDAPVAPAATAPAPSVTKKDPSGNKGFLFKKN